MTNKVNLENIKIGITADFSNIKIVQYNDDEIVNSRYLSEKETVEYLAFLAIYFARRYGHGKIELPDIKKYVEFKVGEYDSIPLNAHNFIKTREKAEE